MAAPDTTATLVAAGVRPATCWDVAAVARLLAGGWAAGGAAFAFRHYGAPGENAWVPRVEVTAD